MIDRLVIPALSLLTFVGGCGLLERAACGEPCEGGTIAAKGESADFTLAGVVNDDATVSEVEPCEEEEDGFVTRVETHGEDAEVETGSWIFDRLVPELAARGLSVSRGLGPCVDLDRDDALGLRIGTHDWRDLDPITQTVLDLAAEDDVALQIVVAVEPEIIACPDIGCGF